MAKSTRHYHAMSGSIGCLPDNNEVYTSKQSAIDSLVQLFDGERGLRTALRRDGLFGFRTPGLSGAEYAGVIVCYEPDCLND